MLLVASFQLPGILGSPPVAQHDPRAVDALQTDDSNTASLSDRPLSPDSSRDEDSEVEWVDVVTGSSAEWPASNLTARTDNLGGKPTNSGRGVYPDGYTGYGMNVWECPKECE